MKNSRLLYWLTGIVLLGVAALVFVFPEPMLSPGPLLKAHQQLSGDCFACHAPLRGSAPEQCIACHEVKQIGLFTTTGQPIVKAQPQTPFHQDLTEQNCLACHAEHRGLEASRALRTFSHSLLKAETREQCASCHAAPKDALHRQVKDDCQQCHSPERWKPASFAHEKFFLLDRDHNVSCATCHTGNNFETFTCYGCHEHTPAKIRAEHEEEGIRDFENCVECHRSADEPEHGKRDGRRERD